LAWILIIAVMLVAPDDNMRQLKERNLNFESPVSLA
jgi:hypothetical protein